MKTLYLFVFLLLSSVVLFAQAPDKMSYQAVVRDADNNLVTNQSVSVRLSILTEPEGGVAAYVETHTPVSNANGLISLEVGNGDPVSGDITIIDWSVGDFYLETQIDPAGGSDYTITSTTQLLSVPYALHAKTAGSLAGAGPLAIDDDVQTTGDYTYASPQTRYFKVDGGSFIKYNTQDEFEIGRNFAQYPTYTFCDGGTPGIQGKLYAPIHLPDGAIITNITARLKDNDGADTPAQVDFVVVSNVSGALIASCATTEEALFPQTISTDLNYEVQNQYDTYGLMYKGNQGGGTDNLLYNVLITYTVSKVD